MKLPSSNTKIGRVFEAFMAGNSYNLFEAETELHDRSLHSTVSTLQQVYGIKVSRQRESVPGYEGKSTSCCRYRIGIDERLRIKHAIDAEKEKALTSSDETIGEGLDTSTGDDSAGGDDGQVSFLRMPVKYVRDCFKAIARF